MLSGGGHRSGCSSGSRLAPLTLQGKEAADLPAVSYFGPGRSVRCFPPGSRRHPFQCHLTPFCALSQRPGFGRRRRLHTWGTFVFPPVGRWHTSIRAQQGGAAGLETEREGALLGWEPLEGSAEQARSSEVSC